MKIRIFNEDGGITSHDSALVAIPTHLFENDNEVYLQFDSQSIKAFLELFERLSKEGRICTGTRHFANALKELLRDVKMREENEKEEGFIVFEEELGKV